MTRRSLRLAALSGAVLALALPPREWAWPAFLYAPLLLLAIEGASIRNAALLGSFSGLVFLVPATWWVAPSASRFGQVPTFVGVLAELLLLFVESLVPAVAAAFTVHVTRRGGRAHLALPAALALGFAAMPMIMPWRPAFLVLPFVDFAQTLALGGAVLLDLLVMGVGTCALEAARRRHRTLGALTLLLVLVPSALGHVHRLETSRARRSAPSVRLGLAQPNVPIAMGRDPRRNRERLDRMHALERALEAQGAEVAVFPESTYPYPVRREVVRDVPPPHGVRAEGLGIPVVAGVLTDAGPCAKRNTILAVDAEGRFVGHADKVRPFPFADTIPLWDALPFLHARFPCRGLAPAETPGVLAVAGAKLGSLVCYDSVEAWPSRALVAKGAEILVEHTNDAWYGDTGEPHMHSRVARMRSIETRRDVVRVTNTGLTEHVAATGERLAALPMFEPESRVVVVPRLEGLTPYARFGDGPAVFLAGLVALLALVRRRGPSDAA